jgi:hypothetical protein
LPCAGQLSDEKKPSGIPVAPFGRATWRALVHVGDAMAPAGIAMAKEINVAVTTALRRYLIVRTPVSRVSVPEDTHSLRRTLVRRYVVRRPV